MDLHQALARLGTLLDGQGRSDDEELAAMRRKFDAVIEQLDGNLQSYARKRRAHRNFELGRFSKALEDLAIAVEHNPSDTSNLTWIPPAAVAACPDERFRTGILALADKTIELTNGSSDAHTARAALHLAMGDLAAVRRDLDSIVVSPATGYSARYQHALLCLVAHNEAAYRADCSEMLRQFHDSRNALELHFAAWTCALAPNAVATMDDAIELARRAVDIGASQDSLLGLGAALFRAGRFQEAMAAFERCEAAAASPLTSPAYAWYFRAMTCFKMGQADEARQWYDKAVTATAKLLNDDGTAFTEPVSWNRRLTLELLKDEAARMISENTQ